MPRDTLDHIPAPRQTPIVGNTLDLVKDAFGLHMDCVSRLGAVYRISMFGRWHVCLASADGTELILQDPDRNFSAAGGWGSTVADIFPGGLFLRDFDDHRRHRRIMNAAFRRPAVDAYFRMMVPALDAALARWPVDRPFRLYPALKDLTFRLGAHVFMGLPLDSREADDFNKALTEEIAAGLTLIRRPLPFTRYRRGILARERLTGRLRALIAERRAGKGEDFFSQMCRAQDEEGQGWTEQEIVDQFNFLLMAAHDTTASTLTALTWYLARNPQWQDRLAAEVGSLGGSAADPDVANDMPLTDRVMRETLRLMAPVPFIPRQALRDFTWNGVVIPAGTPVTAMPGTVMMDPRYFPAPSRFDPDRFAPERAEDKAHKFAWAPFGGGAHKCMGLHFSSMQTKAFVRALLSRFRVHETDAPPVVWNRLPVPKPRGGLPIVLSAR